LAIAHPGRFIALVVVLEPGNVKVMNESRVDFGEDGHLVRKR